MFHSLFNPENTFWRWMAGLADILVLSVLWLLCSVPVVTVGAATAALYDACARGMRGGRGDAWRRFFHTFRAELKTATIACAIWEALLLVLFWVLRRLWAAALAGVSGAAMLGAAYLVVMLIPVGAFCWMFPILSRFTFRVGGLLWTSIQISLAHLPSTVVIVVFAAAAWICSTRLLVPMVVMPCLTALFWSLPMEQVFRRYMPEEPADEDTWEE